MTGTKLLATVFLVFAVLFAQVGVVAAAPQTQDATPITGTIQSITTEKDATGATIVVVELKNADGTTQTVRLSLDAAAGLNLINKTTLQVNQAQVGQTVTIEPTAVLPEEEPTQESIHPIAAILASFFHADPSVVNGYHEDGFGFGVIAQALWMSGNLNDGTADTDLAGEILQAKQSGDYSEIKLPDGFTWPNGSAPTNWGQFKKALKSLNENKDKQNLGVIVSGQAENTSEDAATQQEHGNGKNKDHGKGNGKGHNKNKP